MKRTLKKRPFNKTNTTVQAQKHPYQRAAEAIHGKIQWITTLEQEREARKSFGV